MPLKVLSVSAELRVELAIEAREVNGGLYLRLVWQQTMV